MLIKLIPPLAEPTIHFSLSFPDLPQHLPLPASWMSQYNHLMLEDLEMPNTLHSLDKAAGLPSIIDEVTFDLGERRVRCLFVDGIVEEWDMGIEGDEAKPLQEIVGFVQDSAMEDERDKEREREQREKEKDLERTVVLQHKTSRLSRFSYSSPSLAGPKVNRHKKQRSFFMQIVSSLGSIINLSSPSPQMTTFSDPDTPTQASCSSSPNQRAKALRRAARSGLVDTFRRFVLPVLIRRVPFAGTYNGFCAWILWSMKRRAIERREQILVECGLTSEMLDHATEETFEATTMDVPSSLSDSETESFEVSPVQEGAPSLDDDNGTEYTDGSSLRTPSTLSHSDYAKSKCKKTRMSISSDTFTYRSSTSMSSTSSAEAVQTCETPLAVSQSPVPSSKSQISLLPPPLPPKQPRNYKTQLLQTHLPPHLYAEHIHVVALSQRIEGLIAFRETQARVALEEQRARMEILSVRGRRRAWSAGVKIRGAAGQEGQGQEWGFAIPFRSSPLARYGWVVGGRTGLQRCGVDVDEDDDDGEETDVAEEDCEDFLGGPLDLDDMLELDEDRDPFRSSPTPGSNGISVSGFPVTKQRSNVPYLRSSTPPPSNTAEGRERKHHRSWQKTSTITVPSSEPVITTNRNSYPNPNLHLQNNRQANANRRRASLGPSSLPLSRLFPVSEELEVEMDVREDDMDLEMGLGSFGRHRDYARYGTARRGRVVRSTPSLSDDADQDERHGQGGAYPTFNNHNLTYDREEEDDGQHPTRHYQDDFPTSPTSTTSFSSISSGGSVSFGRSSSPSFTFEPGPRSPSPPQNEYDRARDSPSPPADRRREAFELERPQVLPRVRTRSFGVVGSSGQAQPQPQPPMRQKRSLWGGHRESGGLALSRDSLLCQPLSRRKCPPPGDIGYCNNEEDGEESDDEDFPFDSHHSNNSANVSTVDKMMRISFGRTEFPMPLPNAAQTQSSSSIGNGKTSPLGIPSGVTPDADAEEVQVNSPPRVDASQPQSRQPEHTQKTHHSCPSYPPRFMAPTPSDGLGSGEEFTLAMDVTCKIPSLGGARSPANGGGRKGVFGSPSRILPPVPMLPPPPIPVLKEKIRSPPLSCAFSPRHEGVVHIPRPRPKLGDIFPVDAGVEVEVGLAPSAGLVSVGSA